MRVVFGGEDAEDVVVFVHWLAVVPPLLRIPPVGVGVAVLALYSGGVDPAAVLGVGGLDRGGKLG